MDDLITSYKEGNVILFVGAGVSKNLGLPTWSELINHIAEELGYDPEIYKSFGDSLALAEYYRVKTGVTTQPLCAVTWHKWLIVKEVG